MSYAERLRALEMMYEFTRSLGLHQRSIQPPTDRWQRIKRRWLQQNPHSIHGSFEY